MATGKKIRCADRRELTAIKEGVFLPELHRREDPFFHFLLTDHLLSAVFLFRIHSGLTSRKIRVKSQIYL
jgi:hypothetical protein